MANNVKVQGRSMYAHVVEPHAFNEGDRKKYSVRLLIPEGDPCLDRLESAIAEAKEDFKAKFGKPFPARGDVSLRDADYYEDHPEYRGYKVLNASSSEKFKPVVVDEAVQPLTDASVMYNGIVAACVVKPYAYSAMGNNGIAFALNGYQVVDRTADEIGGGNSAVAGMFNNVAKDLGDLI